MLIRDRNTIHQLIKDIYHNRDGINTTDFDFIFEKIGGLFGYESVGIVSMDTERYLPFIGYHQGVDQAWVRAYNEYYNQLDPTFAVLQAKHLESVADHVTDQNIPKGNNKWREFACDFIQPLGYRHTAAINIRSNIDHVSRSLIFSRTNQQGSFCAEELRYLDIIGFHLSDVYASVKQASSDASKLQLQPEDFVRKFRCTARQAEVAHAVCTSTGTLREIAERFGIDEKSVKSHLTPIYQSAGVKRRGLTALMLGWATTEAI